MTGLVFGIQHFSIHDGYGVRTNVFLMGCPLSCVWCHNPEGMSDTVLLSFNPARCAGCGACFSICPRVHKMEGGVHTLNRAECVRCFRCAAACAGQALEQVGRGMTVDDIMDSVLRDRRYYEVSGGGVTLSGGEPMRQFDFTLAIMEACKSAGVKVALETCGAAPSERYEQIIPLTEVFLYDIKETDPVRHKEYTGAGNNLILNNLAFLSERGARIIIRCPVIPGFNDRADHFEAIAKLTREFGGVEGAEIMPYHKLGVSKAARMGLTPQETYEQPSDETVENWKKVIRVSGGKVIR